MKRFVLHVGAMKTSTTYIQSILSESRSELSIEGWDYPLGVLNQQQAFYGICGSDIPWVTSNMQSAHAEAGRKLVKSLELSRNDVIASAEALTFLSSSGITRLLSKIPAPDCIVFTHRPIEKLLPSAWQQHLKGGGSQSLEDFAKRFFLQLEKSEGDIYRGYAIGEAIKRWKTACDCRVVVVKIPSAKNKTWPLFRDAIGLPKLKEPTRTGANISLPIESANILRSFNILMKKNGLFSSDLTSKFFRECLLKNDFPGGKIVPSENDLHRARVHEAAQWATAVEYSDDIFEA